MPGLDSHVRGDPEHGQWCPVLEQILDTIQFNSNGFSTPYGGINQVAGRDPRNSKKCPKPTWTLDSASVEGIRFLTQHYCGHRVLDSNLCITKDSSD